MDTLEEIFVITFLELQVLWISEYKAGKCLYISALSYLTVPSMSIYSFSELFNPEVHRSISKLPKGESTVDPGQLIAGLIYRGKPHFNLHSEM